MRDSTMKIPVYPIASQHKFGPFKPIRTIDAARKSGSSAKP